MTTESDPGEEQEAIQAPASEATGTRRSSTKRSVKSTRKAPAGAARKQRADSGAAKKKTASSGSSRRGPAKGRPQVEKAPAAAAEEAPKIGPRTLPRILTRFREEIRPAMINEFGYTTPMQVPRLEKIVLNIGIGAEAMEKAAGSAPSRSSSRYWPA